jgi:5-methylcytosine-specific restriction endonuclease McrA
MKHVEKNRQRRREYYQLNRAIELAKYRVRRELNIDKYRNSTNKWRQRNPIQVRQHHALRRARKRNATIGKVDYRAIWQRDQGICHICGQSVSPGDVHFDHVIPLAKGGGHSMDNIKVSHRRCNQQKHDKIEEMF